MPSTYSRGRIKSQYKRYPPFQFTGLEYDLLFRAMQTSRWAQDSGYIPTWPDTLDQWEFDIEKRELMTAKMAWEYYHTHFDDI